MIALDGIGVAHDPAKKEYGEAFLIPSLTVRPDDCQQGYHLEQSSH